MKEQTPITAEEFYVNNSTLSDIELMEQYAQAKVLEALEVVKTLTNNNVEFTSEHIDNLIRSKTNTFVALGFIYGASITSMIALLISKIY